MVPIICPYYPSTSHLYFIFIFLLAANGAYKGIGVVPSPMEESMQFAEDKAEAVYKGLDYGSRHGEGRPTFALIIGVWGPLGKVRNIRFHCTKLKCFYHTQILIQ